MPTYCHTSSSRPHSALTANDTPAPASISGVGFSVRASSSAAAKGDGMPNHRTKVNRKTIMACPTGRAAPRTNAIIRLPARRTPFPLRSTASCGRAVEVSICRLPMPVYSQYSQRGFRAVSV